MYILNVNKNVSINDYSFKNVCVLCYLKISEKLSEILIIKREMLLNFKIRRMLTLFCSNFLHFGFPLDSSDIDLLDKI